MSAAVLVVIGLAVFVGVGDPRGDVIRRVGDGMDRRRRCVALIAGVAVVSGQRARDASERALLFGLATGTLYALTAVLTKATVDLFDDGVLDSLSVTGSPTRSSRCRWRASCSTRAPSRLGTSQHRFRRSR